MSDENDYVAWLRFSYRQDNGSAFLRICDSDAPGAFKVYRHPPKPTAHAEGEPLKSTVEATEKGEVKMKAHCMECEWEGEVESLKETPCPTCGMVDRLAPRIDIPKKWPWQVEEDAPEITTGARDKYMTTEEILTALDEKCPLCRCSTESNGWCCVCRGTAKRVDPALKVAIERLIDEVDSHRKALREICTTVDAAMAEEPTK